MAEVTLKGNPIKTSGELPPVGSKAPSFSLVDKDLNDVTLDKYGSKKKVLVIVPSLDTAVCSVEAEKFNQKAAGLRDVVVLVISCDLPFAQARYCSAKGVENVETLSIMRSRDFAQAYGVLMETGPLKGITARAIVILDGDNKVVYSEFVREITEEPNYDQVLSAVR